MERVRENRTLGLFGVLPHDKLGVQGLQEKRSLWAHELLQKPWEQETKGFHIGDAATKN